MPALTTLLTIAFVWRITRLIVADQILHPLRVRIVLRLGPDHWFAYLVTCAWCMSIWVGAGTLTAAYWWGGTRWWFIMVTAGAASLVTGIGSMWLDPADDDN